MKVPQAAVLEDVSSSAAMPCRRFIQGMGSPARSMLLCQQRVGRRSVLARLHIVPLAQSQSKEPSANCS